MKSAAGKVLLSKAIAMNVNDHQLLTETACFGSARGAEISSARMIITTINWRTEGRLGWRRSLAPEPPRRIRGLPKGEALSGNGANENDSFTRCWFAHWR
jgi:hypothetical protein